jgi:predicted Rossmann fold nucleotide-binding protein DprA/Smf involved in DNA uptake
LKKYMTERIKGSEDEGRMILNGINGVGPVILSHLLERFSNDPWKILYASQSALSGVRGVGSRLAENINCAQSSDWLEKEKAKLGKIGATFLSGPQLPNLLEELDDPPIGLYCLGEVPSIPCISIVGTTY